MIIPLTEDQLAFLGQTQPRANIDAFDAARESTARTILPRVYPDAQRQITSYNRSILVQKFHLLRNNVGLLKHMINRTVAGAVGNGIAPKAVTNDDEWNKRHDEWFERVAMNPAAFDYEERRTFYRMQASVGRELVGPGEAFTNVVDVKGEYLPRFQLIPGHMIKDGDNRRKTMDGLVLDTKSSAVRAYAYVTSENYNAKTQYLDADNVLHVFDMERSGQYRGLPWIYHGINSLIDVGDLTALEKQAAKTHSAMAAVVKNNTGTVGTSGIAGRLSREFSLVDAAAQKELDPDFKNRALEKMLGGQIPFLSNGEELQLLTSTRPSAVFTGFLDWLVRDIAWGFGLPMEYVWKIAELGGANTRFVIDEAQIFFDWVGTLIIDDWSSKVRKRMVGAAINAGMLPACDDPEWPLKVHWQRPARGSVDRGREAQSDIALLEKGLLSHADYHARFGEDGESKMIDRIREVAKQKKKVAEISASEGVEMEWDEIFNSGSGKPGEPASKDPSMPKPPSKK